MTPDRIAELAADVGARLAEPLPPNELIAIEVGSDARLILETAAGGRCTFIGGGELTADQLFELLTPDRSVGAIVAGTRFCRRMTTLHGQPRLTFREVGR